MRHAAALLPRPGTQGARSSVSVAPEESSLLDVPQNTPRGITKRQVYAYEMVSYSQQQDSLSVSRVEGETCVLQRLHRARWPREGAGQPQGLRVETRSHGGPHTRGRGSHIPAISTID